MGYATVTGQSSSPALLANWKNFLLIGLVNAALPFLLITTSELTLTASMAAILNASTPFFAAIVAAVWFGDPLTGKKILGIVLGLTGVVLVVGFSPFPLEAGVLLAVGMMLVASFCYGSGSNLAKARFKSVPTLTMAIGQNFFAGLMLLPLAILNPPPEMPPANALFSVLMLAVLSTAIAYLISFSLIKRVSATSMTTVTMLVPFFSVLWSAMFLQEPMGVGQFVGLLVIVFSITLITGTRLPFLRTAAPAAVTAKSS
ncbi:MAG: DMT family transporter [Anaerolineae bacterium]